jgi:hypothetical protein
MKFPTVITDLRPMNNLDEDIIYDFATCDLSLSDKLEIIFDYPVDMTLLCQPDALVINLLGYCDQIEENITTILVAFKKRFGTDMICRESTLCSKKFQTVLDNMYLYTDFSPLIIQLAKELGFKQASELNKKVLFNDYYRHRYFYDKESEDHTNVFLWDEILNDTKSQMPADLRTSIITKPITPVLIDVVTLPLDTISKITSYL